MLDLHEMLDVAFGERTCDEVSRETPGRYGDERLPAPVVVWNVCRRCNMSCPHCYAAAGEAPSRFALEPSEALRVADELAECGVRAVIFSGGEPLMRPDLLELIDAVRAGGIPCHLSTNGTLLDHSTASALADAGIGYVGVSVDGGPGFNDDYRGLADGFERASRGVENAREAGLRTGLRITLTERNLDQLDAVREHARSLQVDRFYVSHLVDAGRGRAMADVDLDREESRSVVRGLARRSLPWRRREGDPSVVTGGNDSDGPFLVGWLRRCFGTGPAERALALLRRRGGNSAGVGLLNIDARGNVHPDQFWRECTLGNVRDLSVEELLEHPMRRVLATRTERLRGRCGECPFADVCGGSHRERALARNGGVWDSDPACLLRENDLAESILEEEQEGQPCASI
ncbi:MAG: radical SAM protein [Bradymonadaceae bacterium]